MVASVGVQLTTTFMSGRTLSMFYNIAEIKDIVINEAITMVRKKGVGRGNNESDMFVIFSSVYAQKNLKNIPLFLKSSF